jgi:valyl-tRNA synthetase
LENKDFLNRAPENVIRHEKEKKENMILELDKITKNLEMIQ